MGSRWAAFAGKALAWLAVVCVLAWIGVRSAGRLSGDRDGPAPRADATAQTARVDAEAIATALLAAASPIGSNSPVPCKSASEHAPDGVLADGRVVLNRAGIADLVKLPGIGDKRAHAIIALRDRLGRFRSLRDLLRVRGLGLKRLRRLEPLVVIDPPDPAPQPSASPVRNGA